ncbi:catalase protein-like protein [Pholiota molesta]|nr:catalase protein-like protein [Pholiota molesta]
MPFPSDETIVATAGDIVAELQGLFGKHPGFRPAHAKGILLSGSFKPTAEAAALSVAPHFNNASTPILVRFSNSTGIPNIPDTDHHAEPRGIAVRFALGDRVHTDIISHSTPFFPVRTGAEFLEFFKAIKASPDGAPSPTPVQKFVMSHPSALAFVKAPKPSPTSFAKEPYFSVTAFKLVDKAGKETHIRYQFVPELGVETLSDEALAGQSASYLQDEIKKRIAEEGDTVDDATVHWPETRKLVQLGTLTVDGVPSADPLLEMRAAVYLLSGRQRRAAP